MLQARLLALSVAIGLSLPGVLAQTPPQKPQAFGSDAELVLVDVVVADRKGQPVLDLKAADFRVFEDGREREIVSFAAFGAAAARSLSQAPATASPDEPRLPAVPFVPASTAILIDEGHLTTIEAARLGPSLARILGELRDRRGAVLVLAPWSNVAYAGQLPKDDAMFAEAVTRRRGQRSPQISTFPMTDAEALDVDRGDPQALARLVARFTYLNPGMGDRAADIVRNRATELAVAERARRGDTFASMRQGFAWLAKQPGRHTFLLVTSGFAHDPDDPGFEEMINHSLRVNAPIHFLDVADTSVLSTFEGIEYRYALGVDARVSPFDSADGAAGAEQLAAGTGGLRVGGNDLDRGLKRIMDATRLYYILGYEPVFRGKPGFRKIKVEVRGKGLRVRSRRGYFEEARVPLPTEKPPASPPS